MNAVVRSIVILAAVLSSAVAPSESFGYSIEYKGSLYTGTVNFDNHYDYHWDEVIYINDPATGVRRSKLDGNTYGNPWGASIRVIPDAGDPAVGTVPVLFTVGASISINVSLENFEAMPFDYGYTFGARLPGQSTVEVPLGGSQFVRDLVIDQFYESTLVVSVTGASVHVGMGLDGPAEWVPTVIDPSSPGTARVSTWGRISAGSATIIPEPTTLTLLTLGSLALMIVRRRR